MNNEKAAAILQELAKRNHQIDWFAGSFKEQIDFVNDTASQICALCSRRAAKSYSCGIKLLKCAMENPGVTCVYLGLTRDTASKVMISPVLKDINRRLKLGCKFTKLPLACHLPNESVIYLGGINDNDDEQEKLKGQKYKMIVLDECASYGVDLKRVLAEALGPATIDQDGQIVMIGTPGNFRNYFYDITTGAVAGWSRHSWSTEKNPFTSKQFKAKIEKLKREAPGIEDTPAFKQHYLGEWVIDESKKLYKYNSNNLIAALPGSPADYHYILGIDLGWTDDNAFIVGAYSATDPTLYIVYAFSKNKMLMDEMVQEIRQIEQQFPIGSYVIDSANKQYVEDLRYRTRLPLQPAIKVDKLQTIHMLNTDLITKRIRILPTCTPLIAELDTLLLDDSDPAHPKELASQSNHCADAFLYTWRRSRHYLSEPVTPKVNTPESQMEQWEQRELDKLEQVKEMAWYEKD